MGKATISPPISVYLQTAIHTRIHLLITYPFSSVWYSFSSCRRKTRSDLWSLKIMDSTFVALFLLL